MACDGEGHTDTTCWFEEESDYEQLKTIDKEEKMPGFDEATMKTGR